MGGWGVFGVSGVFTFAWSARFGRIHLRLAAYVRLDYFATR